MAIGNEELEMELEALLCTYHDINISIHRYDDGIMDVILPILPRAASEHLQFVSAKLVLHIQPSYPTRPLHASIVDGKGIANVLELEASIQEVARNRAGELVIGLLLEYSIEHLGEMNRPQGQCCFCLEDLHTPVAKLTCFHCFHVRCFASWWQWQQKHFAEREREALQELSALAHQKLKEEGIQREGGPTGAFILPCPICRLPIVPSQIKQWQA